MPVGPLVNFLASINQYGVAKTSHFRFHCTVGITAFPDISSLLGIRCETTELPGRQLVSNDSRIYGPSYKTPHQSVYQEITLSFIETANFTIRAFFEAWTDKIFNSQSNLLDYPASTRFKCLLTQYDVVFDDKEDEDLTKTGTGAPEGGLRGIAQWQLYNAFPTAINQMPVSWSEDGVHRTTITLAFEYYTLWTEGTEMHGDAGNIANPIPVPPKGSSGGVYQSLKNSVLSKFS